jgi:hypothetical protein
MSLKTKKKKMSWSSSGWHLFSDILTFNAVIGFRIKKNNGHSTCFTM